ncbi:MAG: type II toxin-antitoxin system Phd/YefM family antitoxin [Betaproteobacteria bacterium]|nr:type II toxin-antitoxin system Phd/YefM family antitoxin [Betaproteobacteria bacterium]
MKGPTMEISAAEFKAKCLKLMDEIAKTRKPIVITKRGKPVAKLVPAEPASRKPLYGCMAGTVTYEGDLLAPLDVEWEAEAETEPNLYPRKRQGRRRG